MSKIQFKFSNGMKELVENLCAVGVLKTPELIEAFLATDRKDFVSQNLRKKAYIDEALPIGEGQTISQPYTVAFMLELLGPKRGDIILDVGAGSGWQTAILANIVSKDRGDGRVYALERLIEISNIGETNLSKYNFLEKGTVRWFSQSASDELPKNIIFDKIISAASVECSEADVVKCVPKDWHKHLSPEGVIVVPIKRSIWKIIKKENGSFEREEHPGFIFVPYIEK